MDKQSQQTGAWHAFGLSSLEKSLDARPGGLTGEEAAERLKRFGPNELPHQGIVVATGSATHVGQLALDVIAAPGGKPPLLERLEREAMA